MISWSKIKIIPTENEIVIHPIDTINNIILLPERWFIINVADSTIEAFFSQAEFQKFLTSKNLPAKLYNIDSLDKVFSNTGILPCFLVALK